jgi:hypothetical protein
MLKSRVASTGIEILSQGELADIAETPKQRMIDDLSFVAGIMDKPMYGAADSLSGLRVVGLPA